MVIAIVVVIIIAGVTIFSVQNAAPVVMSFLFWKFEASLAIVIFLCLLSGVIVGATIASLIRGKKRGKNEIMPGAPK